MKLFIKPLCSVAIVFSLLLTAGCGDDPDPVSKLVGRWEVTAAEPKITVPGGVSLVSFLVSLGLDQEEAEDYAEYLEDGDDIEAEGVIEFKKDGTYSDGSDDTSGKWELSADEKSLVLDKGTNSEITIGVPTLSDTQLVLDLDLTEDYGFPPNTIQYHALLTLKRL